MLAERRRAARADRDFGLADSLRGEIEAAGWTVIDSADGTRLERKEAAIDRYPTPGAVPSAAHEPDRYQHSLCLAVHGWPDDVRRLLGACDGESVEVVAVDAAASGLAPADLAPAPGWGARLRVVSIEEPIGHADAWNVAARLARGAVLYFVEPSLELGFDVLETLAGGLDDDAVGVVGPFGLGTDDMRTFSADDGADVVALEYLLAVRRADLARVGPFDSRYRFYRNLDIDFSYQVRAAGLAVRRVACGPITRHSHRLWENTPDDERERLSRKNFNRFLDRWGRS